MCVVICAWASLLTAPGSAQPRVHWRAPAHCPQSTAFEGALRARFAGSTTLEQLERVDAIVTNAAGHDYRLSLSVRRAGRATVALRQLTADRCGELLPAAVWLVGLAAGPGGVAELELTQIAPDDEPRVFVAETAPDPSAVSQRADRHDAHAAPRKADAAPASLATARYTHDAARSAAAQGTTHASRREDKDALDEPTRSRRSWHARLAGVAGVFGGAGTNAQASVGGAASISVGPMHTQLGINELLPAERTVAHAGHVQLRSLELRLSECALWGKHVQAGPGAGLALLRTTAHSQDFGHDAQRILLWGLAELGLRVSCPLTKALELSLAGAVGTPLTPRPSFTVAHLGPVVTAAHWSQQGQLGLIYVLR